MCAHFPGENNALMIIDADRGAGVFDRGEVIYGSWGHGYRSNGVHGRGEMGWGNSGRCAKGEGDQGRRYYH